MHLGNRGPGSSSKRRRGAYHPASESLEERRLLSAAVDISTVQTAPLGVQLIGASNTNAGYTVTDVGDTTGSGYDDFIVSSPGLATPTTSATPAFTGTSTAYLVFGSKQVNVSSFTSTDYSRLTAGQRGGGLDLLGTFPTTPATNPANTQINPTAAQPAIAPPYNGGYNYDGLTFTSTANSGLGYSVAALGDINGDGRADFALGAPNATGGGRVYIIYGSAGLVNIAQASKTINLDTATGNGSNILSGAGSKEIVLAGDTLAGVTSTNLANLQVGFSVAGIGNFLNPGTTGLGETVGADVAIGIPGLPNTSSSVGTVTGGAIAISGTRLSTLASSSTPVELATLLTQQSAIRYEGVNSGERAGASVSTAGSFDGARTTLGNRRIDSLLIGAPNNTTGTSISGRAYLVYGRQDFPLINSILGTTYPLSQIVVPTNLVVNPQVKPLQGLQFQSTQGLFGFAVASAGDFNGDGVDDIIIGAPSGVGQAAIYYGQGPTTNRYTGVYGPNALTNIPVTTPPTTAPPALPNPLVFSGGQTGPNSTGDQLGFSVSYVGDIPGEGLNGVIVGAPNTNNSEGAAYIIPGNYATLTAAAPGINITTASTNPTYAILPLTSTGNTAAVPDYIGTSVSARPRFAPSQTNTVDADAIPDVFVGAPGFSFTAPTNAPTTAPFGARTQAGTAFVLEGSRLPVQIPNNVIVTQAAVGVNNPNGPFTLPVSPVTQTFYIFSAAAGTGGTPPAFNPSVDPGTANPVTLTINGVVYTNVRLTAVNNALFPGEVSFSIDTTRLGLVAGSTITISIRGRTNAGLAFVARVQNVSVTAASGGGGGGGVGLAGPTTASILASPVFTGDGFGLPYPPVSSLEHLGSYAPLPVTVAYRQFQVAPGYLARQEVALHPSKHNTAHQAPRGTYLYVAAIGRRSEPAVNRVQTLPHKVFTRDKFQHGQTRVFTHKVKVIPRSEQTQTFTSA